MATVLKMRRWKLVAKKLTLLEKKEKFASKRSDDVFDNMDRENIIENLQKLSEVQSSGLNLETNYLRHRLKSLERTKHLMCWHDGSTVGGRCYIVVTISVMFDMAVFQWWRILPEIWLKCLHPNNCWEAISIHNWKSPSNEQQLFYSDIRLEDIYLLRENLETSDGLPISHMMQIFKEIHLHVNLKLANKKKEFFLRFLQYSREFLGNSSIYTPVKKPQFTRRCQ